ncbi:MAG: MiaB/RimO family radical SAM methylthiotransferase [Candidatus Omnitrophota bacterium]
MKRHPGNKIGIVSLGCPRNLVDAEVMLGRLREKGYSVADIHKADVGIVNTCAFIEDAKAESIKAILELIDLKKEGKLRKIIVSGCLPQRYKKELIRELPEVDAFIGAPALNHSTQRFPITPAHYAYLKICEGCISNCSYCAIPRIKGRLRSLEPADVLAKVEVLNRQGIAELNVIGQDITGYGTDLYGSPQLGRILRGIVKKSAAIGWLRLLYLYPSRVTEEVLDIIRGEERVCKYLDLPLQHVNDRILKLMRRNTKKKDIMRLIEKIRRRIPAVAIRTSLLVGFPSETEREFKELLDFVREVKFERLGAFAYSREEGTDAARRRGQLSEKIKEERLGAVMSLQQGVSSQLNREFLGRTIRVLIDEKDSNGIYLGRSQYDAPEVDGLVYVKSKQPLKAGGFCDVRVTDTLEYDLTGEVV